MMNQSNEINDAFEGLKMIKPRRDEIRGMWHRPFENSLEAVESTMQYLSEIGINHLFVETYFNGKLIFDCERALLKKHDFVKSYGPYGTNLLLAFVEVGKKYGMVIHAWVENFFIGVYQNEQDIALLNIKPTWAMYNADGTILQKNEVNYVFLDPSNNDVQDYIKSLYKAILQIEGIKTIHLDYIRYPVVYQGFSDESDDTGYSEHAIELFSNYVGQKITKKSILNNHLLYEKWCQFRVLIITNFLKDIHDIAKQFNVGISTAVFGDPNHAIKIKQQDWMTWITHGWIEMICPMAYYKDHKRVYEEVLNLIRMVENRALVCAGIAPSYMGLEGIENIKQALEVRRAGAEGMVFFATQNYLINSFQGYHASSKVHADMIKYLLFKEEVKTK